jgi:hypothetical protein
MADETARLSCMAKIEKKKNPPIVSFSKMEKKINAQGTPSL